MRIIKTPKSLLSLVPIAVLAVSCATPGPVGKIRNVVIKEIHPGPTGCLDFVVTDAAVRGYFARAVAITGPEHHHLYDVYPCWAEGTFVVGSETWKWHLNGGAAYVYPPNRPRFIVGDPKKQDLGDEYVLFLRGSRSFPAPLDLLGE